MSRGPKGFSEEEKSLLKDRLCAECEKKWAQFGYKKTNISDLTSAIGISTGSFYALYPSKELFFSDTLVRVQERLKKEILKIIKEEKGKTGFLKAMDWQFQEYERAPFLYDFGTPDFLSFLNKIPAEEVEKMKFDSKAFFYEMLEEAGMNLKIDGEKAHAIVSALLFTVEMKNQFNYSSREIFMFILDSVFADLFK